MSFLPKRFLYMPSGSYSLVPSGLFDDEIAKRPPETYAALSDGMFVLFHKPVSQEMRERFINDYEEWIKNRSLDDFE